ncbi:MAG: DUF1501 domain-containing protein [Gammaproteobacteria bacterium]|nr:DUF1501 domain-containing protein [Gammaproteobacteria bacterium]
MTSTKPSNRRQFLRSNLAAAGGLLFAPLFPGPAKAGENRKTDRILVVVELSGGNDGLNTVVPYTNDAYYNHRPNIAIKAQDVLKLDDRFGLNPGMLGFERLWNTGELAIVHGCGYDKPSFSHFTSMAYWHTASPNSGDEFGWLGRLADIMAPQPMANMIINIGSTQSLAVNSRVHTPVVFDNPERFQRNGFMQQRAVLDAVAPEVSETSAQFENPTRRYLNDVARSARSTSALVRRAWAEYKTPIDYGIGPIDLPKVAACIAHGLPTPLYHVSFRNNAFDTHVQQPALHRRLLSYACDGIHGFLRDVDRLGFGDRVVVLVYSEFGRRVPENANLGTDHGSANVMFLAGKRIKGGHYGTPPSLTELTDGDNLIHTVDFRRVYGTAIDGWLQQNASAQVLKGQFQPLPVFA